MIKTLLQTITFFGMVFIFIAAVGKAQYAEDHYYRNAKVGAINENYITFVDNDGNHWKYADCQNLEIGTEVRLEMFTNYTLNTINDDEIISFSLLTEQGKCVTIITERKK